VVSWVKRKACFSNSCATANRCFLRPSQQAGDGAVLAMQQALLIHGRLLDR
jgi:hypothetical protein